MVTITLLPICFQLRFQRKRFFQSPRSVSFPTKQIKPPLLSIKFKISTFYTIFLLDFNCAQLVYIFNIHLSFMNLTIENSLATRYLIHLTVNNKQITIGLSIYLQTSRRSLNNSREGKSRKLMFLVARALL